LREDTGDPDRHPIEQSSSAASQSKSKCAGVDCQPQASLPAWHQAEPRPIGKPVRKPCLFSGKHRYEVDCCFFKPWIKFAKCSSLREIWQRRKFWTGLFISLCQKKKSGKPLCASSVRFGLRLRRESCRSSGAASGTEPFALGGVF
jgi:hypothetical protein